MEKQDDAFLLTKCDFLSTYDYQECPAPNIIQLVESELPICEAVNHEFLAGMFIFRQMYSPYDQYLWCLFCCDKYCATEVSDLENHYDTVHDLEVYTARARFNESTVFICLPSYMKEYTTLNTRCRFCDANLKNLAAARNHFATAHEMTVRVLPESEVIEISNYFYCSICEQASSDFQSHSLHMKIVHKLQSCFCRDCKFCMSLPVQHRTHVKDLYHCPVCPDNFKRRDYVTKHIMLSHAILTGPKTWSCANCFNPCQDPPDLINHVINCSKMSIDSKSKTRFSVASCKEFYRSWICSMAFLLEEEIKKNEVTCLYFEDDNEEDIVPSEENNNVYGRYVDKNNSSSSEKNHSEKERLIDDITEHMVAMDLTQAEEEQTYPDESESDSASEEQTQLICGWCWSSFNSLKKFMGHVCLEKPNCSHISKEKAKSPRAVRNYLTVSAEQSKNDDINVHPPETGKRKYKETEGSEQTELVKESKCKSVTGDGHLMICAHCFDIFKSPNWFAHHICQQQTNCSGLGQSDQTQDDSCLTEYVPIVPEESFQENFQEFVDQFFIGTEKPEENNAVHQLDFSQHDFMSQFGEPEWLQGDSQLEMSLLDILTA